MSLFYRKALHYLQEWLVSSQRKPIVIRGARQHSLYAPKAGYRYDGLYRVADYWREVGKAGFYIWRFRLVKIVEVFTQEL